MSNPKTYDWNIFAGQWVNFKSWVMCCEKAFGPDATVSYSKLQEMIAYVDKTTEAIDDEMIRILSTEPDDKNRTSKTS
jgi:hypothetical protein